MSGHAALRLSLAAVAFLAGCASAGKMQDQPLTSGTRVFFAAPNDYVKRAAREALIHAKYEITEEKELDASTYSVLGLLGISMQSNGQWGRVVVKKVSNTESQAWVHTMRRIDMNITENIDITRQAVTRYMGELVEHYKEDDKAAARQRR